MEILFGILIPLLLEIFICFYYSYENLKENKDGKIKIIFCRTKDEYKILIASFMFSVLTFIIGSYIYRHQNIFWIYKWQVAIGILVPIAVIDFKKRIIPNKLLIIGFIFAFAINTIQIIVLPDYIISILGNSFVGLIVGGGVFFLASLFVKNGIGAGDIKMFLFLGFLLAFRGIFNVLLYSMIISAIYALVLIISKKMTLKDELPLAPFTLIGIAVSILFGV